MRFPRHWVMARGEGRSPDGQRFEVAGWGFSDLSEADAQRSANETLKRMIARIARGEPLDRYSSYADRPLREPVLEQSLPGAIISRNSYGCEVLNTSHAMFIDIDLPEIPAPGLISRLFGKKAPAEDPEREAMARVQAWLARNPDWGFRAYRTKAGLRLLAVHAPMDAETASYRDAMTALGADPLYIKLCDAQKSYRARLTPKPWRCDMVVPPERWPFTDGDAERRFQEWQAEYQGKQLGYAVCEFRGALGAQAVHPQLAEVVALHDRRTGAQSGRPLA